MWAVSVLQSIKTITFNILQNLYSLPTEYTLYTDSIQRKTHVTTEYNPSFIPLLSTVLSGRPGVIDKKSSELHISLGTLSSVLSYVQIASSSQFLQHVILHKIVSSGPVYIFIHGDRWDRYLGAIFSFSFSTANLQFFICQAFICA